MTDSKRRRREDGANTRDRILEAAAGVFAEIGVDRATGKMIAARAATNSASVNYYFGGVDGLYIEVLVHAHERLVSLDFLSALAQGPGTAEDKLRLLIGFAAGRILRGSDISVLLKVLIREIMNPSPAFAALKDRQLLPKKTVVLGLVSEYLDLPADDPATAAATLAAIAPFLVMLIGERTVVPQLFPELLSGAGRVDALAEVITTYTLAGLTEIRSRHKSGRPL